MVTHGRAVLLEDLQLTGLRDEAAKEEKGRQFACPHCGASVEVTLATTKAVTCRACNSVIDLSQGIGGELRHAAQDEPVQPLIPLGTTGQLQGVQWQVVGFQHRMGQVPGDDEQFGWSEYLLYHRKRGFIFLVDSEEGWSVVKPTTGAPTLAEGGRSASYLGVRYPRKDSYNAETVYVAGEFYWPVARGQKTFNQDFARGSDILSMEQTPSEITWSSGSMLTSDTVAQAFGLQSKKELLRRGDAGPTSVGSAGGLGCGTLIALFFVVLVLLLLVKSCRNDCDPAYENCSSGSGSRSSGGAWGGYSSGGGHK